MTIRLSTTKTVTATEATNVLSRTDNWLAGVAPVRTPVAASPYAVLNTDVILGVSTAGGARVINMNAAPGANKTIYVVDETGNSATNNITVNPGAGHTINGLASYVMAAPFAAAVFYFDGTSNWAVESVGGVIPSTVYDNLLVATFPNLNVRAADNEVNATFTGLAGKVLLLEKIVFVLTAETGALAGDATVRVGTTTDGVDILPNTVLTGLADAGLSYTINLTGLMPAMPGNDQIFVRVKVADTGAGATGAATAYLFARQV